MSSHFCTLFGNESVLKQDHSDTDLSMPSSMFFLKKLFLTPGEGGTEGVRGVELGGGGAFIIVQSLPLTPVADAEDTTADGTEEVWSLTSLLAMSACCCCRLLFARGVDSCCRLPLMAVTEVAVVGKVTC